MYLKCKPISLEVIIREAGYLPAHFHTYTGHFVAGETTLQTEHFLAGEKADL